MYSWEFVHHCVVISTKIYKLSMNLPQSGWFCDVVNRIMKSWEDAPCSMAYTKTRKPERVPIGDEYLPDVSEAELREMVVVIPGCKDTPKELLMLTALTSTI